MTNPHPKTRSVQERFFKLLPYRRELSIRLFDHGHSLSTSRLFVLLALCEAEIPSKASIRAMARELPLDFPVPRVRSMRYYTRVSQVLMKLERRGTVERFKRDGITCFEVIERVRCVLYDLDASGPDSDSSIDGDDGPESSQSDADESPANDPGTGSSRGNGDPGCIGPGENEPESHGRGGENETT